MCDLIWYHVFAEYRLFYRALLQKRPYLYLCRLLDKRTHAPTLNSTHAYVHTLTHTHTVMYTTFYSDICRYFRRKTGAPRRWEDPRVWWNWPTESGADALEYATTYFILQSDTFHIEERLISYWRATRFILKSDAFHTEERHIWYWRALAPRWVCDDTFHTEERLIWYWRASAPRWVCDDTFHTEEWHTSYWRATHFI